MFTVPPYRLAILATHPIQYHTPWYRALAASSHIDLEVLFCHDPAPVEHAAAGFGVEFEWDVPLLDGYAHRFLTNVAKAPSVNSFAGLDTPEIATLIAGERFDAVLVNGWNFKSAWQAFFACWRVGTAALVRGDSHLYTPRSRAKSAVKWPLYRSFIPRFDACLSVGSWSREYFLHYGALPERIFHVPHVVDEHRFVAGAKSLESKRSHLRAQWMTSPTDLVALFSAKFIEKKRPMDFIRSIEAARARGACVSGLMVGDGPLRIQCESYCRARNLPIQFTGFLNQSRIVEAYVAADVLVLPSDGETWGLVVNEMMTCGRPCIVSDRVGCGPDLISCHGTGDIFSLGDIDYLGSLLAAYSRDRNKLRHMGVRARKRIQCFSVPVAVEGIESALAATESRRRRSREHEARA